MDETAAKFEGIRGLQKYTYLATVQIPEMNREMSLSDLHTVCFSGLKKPHPRQ